MQILRARPWAMSRNAVLAVPAARAPQKRATMPWSRRATSTPSPLHASASGGGGGGDNATSTPSSSTSPSSDAAASASRALRLVDEAMELLHRELFVSEALARATGEEPEHEDSVVARVVEALAKGETKTTSGSGFKGSFERQGADDDELLLGLSSASDSSPSSQQRKQEQPTELDEAFVVALGVAAAAATTTEGGGDGEGSEKRAGEEDPRAREVVRRLRLLREATLNRASASLPAELRALDAAARAATAEERRAVIRRALLGDGEGGKKKSSPSSPTSSSSSSSSSSSPSPTLLKRVSPAAFYSASCQVIDDMEERQIVPDAALLARVVLCRDDALALQRGGGGGGGGGGGVSGGGESAFAAFPSEDADLRDAVSSHGAMLHRAGAEFAGMLLSQCKNSDERRELVRKVMRRGDVLAWQGAATDEASVPSLKKARAAPRPGRLFAALYATRDALAAKGDSERAKALDRARSDAAAVMEEVAGYNLEGLQKAPRE